MSEIVIERIEVIDPKQDAPARHVVFTENPGEAFLIETLAGTHNDNCAQYNAVNVRRQSVPRCFSEDMHANEILGNEQWWTGGENARLTIVGLVVLLGKKHMFVVTDIVGSTVPAHIQVGSTACFYGFHVHYRRRDDFPMPKVTAIYRCAI